MLILMGLTLIGLIVAIVGIVNVIIGITKKNKKKTIKWILITVIYWAILFALIEGDRRAIEKIKEENPDTWHEIVW